MKFVSTRDKNKNPQKINSADAIKKGIADDGGLYMPEEIIKLSDEQIKTMAVMDYPLLAAELLSLYLTDYKKETLQEIAKKSYSRDKFPNGALNTVRLDDDYYVLELYHGPTCAFKDMALQIMPRLLSEAFEITGEKRTAHILVATSGDTGKAALDGFAELENVEITVFYPAQGVSKLQKLQMDTQSGENVNVCAVDGNFDDCQTGVKKIFADGEIKKEFRERDRFFSSANSINFGRLIPQVVYYFYAYFDMVRQNGVKLGESIDICVPTGNFGNILAGYIAKKMGLPIGRLICASNVNNILTDFFKVGVYDKNRNFYTTISPSMDILISSNLERLTFLQDGAEANSVYMESLAQSGSYKISESAKFEFDKIFCGLYCDETDTKKMIKDVFDRYNYLIDTHTAVAFKCAEEYKKISGIKNKMLILSTASAYKFSRDVCSAFTDESVKNEFEIMDNLSTITKTSIPVPLKELKDKKVRFKNLIKTDEMKKFILDSIK